jgi:ElaB/YqjD/DUF883 family membrane-anchored ribosome-binding protein
MTKMADINVSLYYSTMERTLEQLDWDWGMTVIELDDSDDTFYVSIEEAKQLIEDLESMLLRIENAKVARDEEKRKREEAIKALNEQQQHQRQEMEEVERRVDAIKETGYFVTQNNATMFLTEAEQAVLAMLTEKANRMSE